jgi:benzil reductase ((S)-benzoin forming)
MKSNVYIITGSSNGFGLALAKELSKKNQTVIGLSRSIVGTRPYQFKSFVQYKIDFSKPIEKKLNHILTKHKKDFTEAKQVVLINNAAQIEPIDQIQKLNEKDILKHFQVNLSSVVLMTAVFLKHIQSYKKEKIVVQITSGAAISAVEGWALYCAGKAGVNMFNQVLAQQMKSDSSFKCIGYSPGGMDTAMQKKIRTSSQKQFPELKTFKDYKTTNKLRSPDYVARDLIRALSQFDTLVSGEIIRVS